MELKVPPVGESVTEALIARWLKSDGSSVAKDEAVCEIETDKVTLEITSEIAGTLSIVVQEGETVKIGTVIARIEEGAAKEAKPAEEPRTVVEQKIEQPPIPPAPRAEAPQPQQPPQPPAQPQEHRAPKDFAPPESTAYPSSPSGRKQARERGEEGVPIFAPSAAQQKGAEPTVKPAAEGAQREVATPPPSVVREEALGRITRKPMTPIRKRIAERLVVSKQSTAMLTTFNEADMSEIMALRKKHGEKFLQRHKIKLGLMSFFVRACCDALRDYPEINASIEGDDVVYHHYCDLGIAVGSEKGLVVPVLRSAETLTLAQIEQRIADLAEKVRGNRITIGDLEGGTFTISNGGIYGSLLSTPILNPPQSGVLGMHAIQDRAVVRDGAIVIRPMMYLALSYDHRIVDGTGAVGFLKRIKECIEDPEEMLLEG
ncbi:2-oxoglutarate dehydrogenase complex dihydrolipoyllysine-residue succinyltransferase [Geomonas sp. RF6]|uniref:2-oxoglutarate dehydrogenase complex dihydrolipoyllysine-residue succinyltransferase n=1 Tax=Geomonas sp. RF6 TaxID=2897342 RepID=UPI001E563BAB|nr:2-oxoglutarate dehydrogenase complex dihydrolipoyllysine-residue succinyltransferase [Geomonas sp. RF6]UFS71504.1 2-oxoglutarate dehydrogenase complex dihydrolipoyllysine-residue succinyltransferase [Geomonas sp. RF6]